MHVHRIFMFILYNGHGPVKPRRAVPRLFILTFLLVSAVALLTMSYQTVKAAIAHPVKSLKCEERAL